MISVHREVNRNHVCLQKNKRKRNKANTTTTDRASFIKAVQKERRLYRYLAQSAPIAPIAFKTASVLTPSGLIDGLNPTVSSPFYGIEGWTVHFDKG